MTDYYKEEKLLRQIRFFKLSKQEEGQVTVCLQPLNLTSYNIYFHEMNNPATEWTPDAWVKART